jgi:flagellar assembly protein FliH
MTFSSSQAPQPAFVERSFAAAGFVAGAALAAAPAHGRAGLDAEAERARIEQDAFARGVAAGLAEAEAAHAETLRTGLAALESALAGLRGREEQQQEELARAGLSLALAAAKQVLRRELATDIDALAPCLAEAFASLPPGGEIVLSLAPRDLARLESGAAGALHELAGRWNARLAQDARLAPGEARVEASGAQVELVLAPQLARLEAALLERLALGEVTP